MLRFDCFSYIRTSARLNLAYLIAQVCSVEVQGLGIWSLVLIVGLVLVCFVVRPGRFSTLLLSVCNPALPCSFAMLPLKTMMI